MMVAAEAGSGEEALEACCSDVVKEHDGDRMTMKG
jgi:hypothetical protein